MLDFLKELFGRVNHSSWHNPSNENFDERSAVFLELLDFFRPKLISCKENAVNSASRVEYCKTSTLYPRGYYCPDPLVDIISSNERRGRIKKQQVDDPLFTYYFDDDGELSLVVQKEKSDGRYRLWNELLFSFNGMRIGINFLDESIADPDNCGFYVNIETGNDDWSEYVISEYHVHREYGFDTSVFESGVVRIGFTDGLPTSSTDIYNIAAETDESIETADWNKESTTMLEYNDKGYPCSMKWDGKPCAVGHVKKPNMSGMMKR